jgi:hypothetical protein
MSLLYMNNWAVFFLLATPQSTVPQRLYSVLSSELDPPPPLPHASVFPHPPEPKGEWTRSSTGEGVGVPIRTTGEKA